MQPERPAQVAAGHVPPCLAYGPWLAAAYGEEHRHVCMLDQGHETAHRCVWHPQDRFAAQGYLDRDIIP